MTNRNLQQLIEKFWSGKASEEERHILLDYLHRHRELRTLMERTYMRNDHSEKQPIIDVPQSDTWLQRIHVRAGITGQTAQRTRIRPVLWISAAAMLVLSLAVGLTLHIVSRPEQIPQEQAMVVPAPITHQNTGQEAKLISLPDSSVVRLSPNSELTYSSEYGSNARGVRLSGRAIFKVMPNREKPFTVYANGFATTALGTEFIVSTREAGKTMIQLLSGKVVVTSTRSAPFVMTATYLKPGDELRIDALEETLSMTHTPSQGSGNVRGPLKSRVVAETLQFSRTPLVDVFQRLAEARGIRITVQGTRLKGLSFSGAFLPTDSLETMLSIVCTMNDLNYRYEKDDHIVITNK
ncbi:FecR family protein [Parapedobacter lycopersici]|uniref:FecR family protein n=1 Tax=Parapedobacter lycopersici TaxID=1864939 RepID=UPI00214DC5F0|nr:FecR family protein [Parapedobacter lycopersici]